MKYAIIEPRMNGDRVVWVYDDPCAAENAARVGRRVVPVAGKVRRGNKIERYWDAEANEYRYFAYTREYLWRSCEGQTTLRVSYKLPDGKWLTGTSRKWGRTRRLTDVAYGGRS